MGVCYVNRCWGLELTTRYEPMVIWPCDGCTVQEALLKAPLYTGSWCLRVLVSRDPESTPQWLPVDYALNVFVFMSKPPTRTRRQ